jgi:RNA polymerase-binding transcription factor DksA
MTDNHRLTDTIDIASQLELQNNEDALNAVRSLVPQERDEPDEEPLCSVCEEPYPKLRWSKGFDYCTSCASLMETKGKFYAKKSRHYDSYDD